MYIYTYTYIYIYIYLFTYIYTYEYTYCAWCQIHYVPSKNKRGVSLKDLSLTPFNQSHSTQILLQTIKRYFKRVRWLRVNHKM